MNCRDKTQSPISKSWWHSKPLTVINSFQRSHSIANNDRVHFREGCDFDNLKFGCKSSKKGNNLGSTCSGKDYNSEMGIDMSAKKEKKWYKFGFSKNSAIKLIPGKESKRLDHGSSTLLIPRSSSSDDIYGNSSLEKGVQRGSDAEHITDWSTHQG